MKCTFHQFTTFKLFFKLKILIIFKDKIISFEDLSKGLFMFEDSLKMLCFYFSYGTLRIFHIKKAVV